MQRSLSELEGLKVPVEGGEKIKAVNERATLFRITSNAMINVSGESRPGFTELQPAAERALHQKGPCDKNTIHLNAGVIASDGQGEH